MEAADVQALIERVGVAIDERLNAGLTVQSQALAKALSKENLSANLTQKPKSFSGKYEDWPVWSSKMLEIMRRLAYQHFLEQAVSVEPEEFTSMTEDIKQPAVVIYDVMVDTLKAEQ